MPLVPRFHPRPALAGGQDGVDTCVLEAKESRAHRTLIGGGRNHGGAAPSVRARPVRAHEQPPRRAQAAAADGKHGAAADGEGLTG